MERNAKKAVFYALFIVNLCVILYFWNSSSGSSFTQGTSGIFIALGRLFGLLGMLGVLMQILMIGRTKWIEQVFGLDKLSRVHHYNGIATLLLLIFHPILLITGYSMLLENSFVAQFLTTASLPGVLLAIIALIMLIAIVFLSIVIVRRKLKYEMWYLTHIFVYAVIVLAFFHQIWNGTDIISNDVFRYYWYALIAFVAANLLIFRFFRPIYNSSMHDFRIMKVEKETIDSTSVYITGKDIDKFRIRPGQFMIVRFMQKGFYSQAHPFSLSGYDFKDKKYLRLTIKSLGDFTSQIPKLKKGTRIIIDGPHGIFTEDIAKRKRFLMIAGGVGITPIRSITEEQLMKGNDVTLLYGSRNSGEIIFRKEFDDLKKRYPKTFRVNHILSNDEKWKGEKGFVNKERISRLAKDFKTREIYVCGPKLMMNTVITDLQSLGAEKKYIHYERFSL